MALTDGRLERAFPQLSDRRHEVTSPARRVYNCFAWAANESARWWGPDRAGRYYWPASAPRNYTLDAFEAAFRTRGFDVCETQDLEPGWERTAFFAKDGVFTTHAARQLEDGTWTSKLGKGEDISHDDLDQISGQVYGKPARFMRRRRR